jgi:hypothetical protein
MNLFQQNFIALVLLLVLDINPIHEDENDDEHEYDMRMFKKA